MKLIKQICERENIDTKEKNPRYFLSIIDNYKNEYSPSELAKIISNKTGLSKRVIYNKIVKK